MTKEHPFTLIQMKDKEFVRTEKIRDKCKDKYRCLSDPKRECVCDMRTITYTFGERKNIQEAVEYYKDDVCSKECKHFEYCKGSTMKVKGVSGRNGPWVHSQTANRKSAYPLFRYIIYCKEYNGDTKTKMGTHH